MSGAAKGCICHDLHAELKRTTRLPHTGSAGCWVQTADLAGINEMNACTNECMDRWMHE